MLRLLVQKLPIEDPIFYEGFCVSNINDDKILVLMSIESLAQVDQLTLLLPSLKDDLWEKITNSRNTDDESERVPLSKFLWDLYIIGLHQWNQEEDRFDAVEVASIQRDRFVARKIILEYQTEEELIQEFRKVVMPQMYLNDLYEQLPSVRREAIDYDLLGGQMSQVRELLDLEEEEE